MTLLYVRSGAAGAATGADWANAYLTLAAALTAAAAGDTIYVSEDHAETQASSMTLTSPGTATSPINILCVNHSGSVPPVSADLRTTATVTTTGSTFMLFSGASTSTYIEGITFSAGTSGTGPLTLFGSSNMTLKTKNCAFQIGAGVGTSSRINFGSASVLGCRASLEATTFQFSNASQFIQIAADVTWKNTASAITGATLPTKLFAPIGGAGGKLDIRGVDLSAISGTLVGATATSTAFQWSILDCKINASATISATPTSRGTGNGDYARADSGGTNYKHGRIRYEGTQTEETTIVRSGGASDGTTAISWKIVTTANSSEHFPFECIPIAIWNDTTGSSVTATIEGIWGGGAVPNNDDIWLAVEYLGSSGSPLASFVNNGKADILASNAALSAGSGTWGGSTTKFALAVTFTPQQKGWIYARIKAAAAASTFYIDPKVTLS